jgi:TonB-linked SusC/RagA family outer membrane protein
MRSLATSLFVFVFLNITFGQSQISVSGKVIDQASNQPVIGCNILVEGTGTGTITDIDGAYSLKVDPSATLTFSYTGYKSQSIQVSGKTIINVSMEVDFVTLDEVVVIGYQTVNRRDVTGSVSSINSTQIRDIPLTNAAEAITGRLAGVQLVTSEGGPGADILVRVRGGSSITQDNTPIYVVDGIQVEDALRFLSPQDIESIDVLKDASATAIYGARGANGVVIITTKSGKGGRTSVSYNGAFGYRKIFKTLDVLNPYDFVRWQYERTRGSVADSTSFANQYGTWADLNKYNNVNEINWQEEVFGRNAPYQNHNFSINGGSQNTNYNLSLTYNKEDGVQIASAFDRKLITFKLDHKANEKFKTGFNFRVMQQTIDGAGTTESGTRTTNRLRHSVQYRPFNQNENLPLDYFDNELFISSNQLINPIQIINAEYRQGRTTNFNTSGYLQYNFTKQLSFKTTVGYDNNAQVTDFFFSKITSRARNFSSLPVAQVNTFGSGTINNSNVLQYNNTFNKKHDFNALIGHEIFQRDVESSIIETRYLPSDITADKALANLGLGAPPTGATQARPITNNLPSNRLVSFFGRASYTFDNKYIATFSLRSDRSSKFNYENGALLFPSGSVAWRFSNEKFASKLNWLSDGKVRIGYGTAGNNRIEDLLFRQLYNANGEYALNSVIQPGFSPISLANENLKWEKNISQNIGLDLGFLGNRIQVTLDAYKNKGQDLLLAVAIPPTTGYASQIQNLGTTSNSGLEMQINANIIQKKNFKWSSNFNIYTNTNEVLSLGPITQQTRNSGWQGSDGTDDYLVKVGDPVGQMYGFVTDGFYKIEDFTYNAATGVYTIKPGIAVNAVYGTPGPGMLKWKDLDGDGVITADKDRTILGNANPDFLGGWNNQVQYKNIDLSIFVNWVVGNDIYNANKIEMTDGSFTNINMLNIMKNRWTNINNNGQVVTNPEELAALNVNAQIWSPVRVQRYWLHSWAVEDGSFLRINNLTLGYTFPKSLLSKIRVANLRIYGTVNNLATFTKYTGYDPDVNTRRSDPLTQGVDFAGYPRARTWVTGINLNF